MPDAASTVLALPLIAAILGTTVAALDSDGAAASDYIFLRMASAWL